MVVGELLVGVNRGGARVGGMRLWSNAVDLVFLPSSLALLLRLPLGEGVLLRVAAGIGSVTMSRFETSTGGDATLTTCAGTCVPFRRRLSRPV